MPNEKQIATLLLDLGVFPHFDGYHFTIEAVKMLLDGRPVWGELGGNIYPKVGEKFGKDAGQVERSIRHCRITAEARQTPTWGQVIGRYVNKVTNAQFLALIVEWLRLGMDEGVA